MYGTVARLHIKPGMLDRFQELAKGYEELEVPGYLGTTIYLTNAATNELHMAVVFESKAEYDKNSDAPEQAERYSQMAEMLLGEPEWHDGEIVYRGT